MTTVVVRAATPADLEAVTEIYAHDVLEGTGTFETIPPDLSEMTRRYDSVRALGLPWLVAEQAGRVLGYGYLGPFRTRPAYRYTVEDSIYIAPGARGLGLGRGLLQALIDEAQAQRLHQVLAVIGDSGNAASVGLHRVLGFQDAGRLYRVGWKFDRWLDVVLMQLDLAPDAEPPTGDGLPL